MPPTIELVEPNFALPGGEIRISGSGLMTTPGERPRVVFGSEDGTVIFGSNSHLVAQVPEEATGPMLVGSGEDTATWDVAIAQVIAENLHPVANPAVDRDG